MMKKILIFLGLTFLLLPLAASSQAEQINSFSAKIIINTDSTINVEEVINYYFDSPRHGIVRLLPYRYLDKTNNKNFQTPITNISVTDANNIPYEFSQSKSGNKIELKIGDPNNTITGEHIYKINYKVTGVINYFNDHDELYWNVTGNDWGVPIGKVSAEVNLPQNVEVAALQKKCFTGETGSTEQNCSTDILANTIIYSAEQGPLTIVAGWNKGVVTPIARQYERTWRHESGWFWLILPITLILLLVLYFTKGKDPFGRGTIAPEFDAPDGLLPAEIGTLIDEKAGNIDISATIVDLAVRGYLKIKNKDGEYSLIKVKEADNNLKDYESALFKALLSEKKEVDLSDLHINEEIKTAKENLYQDLVKRGYFGRRPDRVRNDFLLWGFLIVFFCGIFFWLSWNLVFSLFFSGITIVIFAKFMPKKTKEGVILKEKSLGLKEFLYRADRYKLKWQEKENIFEKFLPYAMVFGVVDQWAKNFKDLYKEPPDWYQGDFATFNAVVFASEMSHFSSSAQSSYSPPASSGSSGFGGGGSSGGGFGGGGGGSW